MLDHATALQTWYLRLPKGSQVENGLKLSTVLGMTSAGPADGAGAPTKSSDKMSENSIAGASTSGIMHPYCGSSSLCIHILSTDNHLSRAPQQRALLTSILQEEFQVSLPVKCESIQGQNYNVSKMWTYLKPMRLSVPRCTTHRQMEPSAGCSTDGIEAVVWLAERTVHQIVRPRRFIGIDALGNSGSAS